MLNGSTFIRREIMIRLVRAFDAGTLRDELAKIPVKLRPKGQDASRCCVYHDRAIIKYRLMSLLGISADEETDESKSIKEYFDEISSKYSSSSELAPLSVCAPACSGCPDSKIISTPNCRGCFARPCVYNCPKKAISVVAGKSIIDQSLCVKCGKCVNVCPYHAIVKTSVPCEEACPVGAIRKNGQGVAEIDFSRCVFCGKCLAACPFGAVMERSQLFEVLSAMKRGDKLVAMVAPAAYKQFPGTVEQLLSACIKAGFTDVIEVALGAEMTTEHETHEFLEKISADPKALMTTSCCPAYVNLVRKHLPDFMKHVSTTPSPMVFTRDIVKEKDTDAKTVFIGPCVAKRAEAKEHGIDYVLSFEELGAIFAGRKIDSISCEPWPVPRPASVFARNFAKSCGVTEAVLEEAMSTHGELPKLDSKQISGIDKKTCSVLKLYSMGKLPANFLEVMACQGGCVNGPCSLQ